LYRALQARRDLARDVPATSSSEALRAVEAAVRSWPDGTGPYPATAWREQAYVSEVDGTAQPYALYVPPDYDPARTYPLVVDLHGSFNTHWGEGAVFSRYGREDPRFMRVAICARACMLYEPLALKDLWDVVAEVKARYNIDADKLCFVGYSAGAYAIHHLAIAYPDRIGAAVAVAGAGNGANAATLAGLPLLLRNGFDDSVVPWTGAAGRMALVQDAGTGVQVEILPATGHAVPVSGAIETLLARYAATRREADLAAAPGPGLPSFPALVQTEADRPGPLWNRGVGLIALRDPAERAGVAIRTAGEGSFAIRTANLELVALDFGQRDPGGLRGLTVDGQEVAVPSPAIGRYAVLRLAGSTWTLAFQAEPPAPDPVAYRSGGIFTVYDGTPLLIVAPASRAEVATILAGRLAYGRSAFVKIPSVLDTALTDEQMQYCNLIVVGGPGENELVKRLAAAKGWPLPFLTAPFAATPPSASPAPAPVPWRCRSRSPLLNQPSAVVLGGERFELARFGVSLVTRNPLAPTRRLWLIASEDARGYQPGSALLNMASWRAPAPDLRLVEISRNLRYDDWQLTRTWTVSENPMDRTLRD
jgi:predicted esterase